MKSRTHRALLGLVTASCLALPALAGPPKKGKPAPKKPPAKPAPKKGGDAKAGKDAFKAEGCTGCHKAKDFPDGGAIGPDLSKVGAEKKADQIKAYIQHPKTGSMMPAFKGKADTLENMTAYLATVNK